MTTEHDEALTDATTVHLNMLRGGIAKITMSQCAHLHGMTNIAGWSDMTIAQLETAVARIEAAKAESDPQALADHNERIDRVAKALIEAWSDGANAERKPRVNAAWRKRAFEAIYGPLASPRPKTKLEVARELLAKEYDDADCRSCADAVRSANPNEPIPAVRAAQKAVLAALELPAMED